MPGYGVSSYGTAPFGVGSLDVAANASGQIVSSRRFDAFGRVVQTGDRTGAFEGMSDTLNRAYVLLRKNVRQPDKILSDYEAQMRSSVYSALRPLTKPPNPVLRIDLVTVDKTTPSSPFTSVTVTDLTDGAQVTIRLPSTVAY